MTCRDLVALERSEKVFTPLLWWLISCLLVVLSSVRIAALVQKGGRLCCASCFYFFVGADLMYVSFLCLWSWAAPLGADSLLKMLLWVWNTSASVQRSAPVDLKGACCFVQLRPCPCGKCPRNGAKACQRERDFMKQCALTWLVLRGGAQVGRL